MKRLYMLDTDSVSYALRGQGKVGSRILEHRPSELCVSAITVAELRYGASRRDSAKLHQLIDTFIANVAVMPFDDDCAGQFGTIAATLAERGSPIGDFDVLIAAHAVAAEATLVTNNVKHFARVDGLHVENWA
ncbi:MAG TPA: PIN domain-containing protein [Thermoanaerobaculia bacterium]